MRKIIVGAQVSMDGVMQAPGGPTEDPTKGFKFGGWAMPYFDQPAGEEIDRVFKETFDLLLGRRTYEIFAAYWPYQDEHAPHGRITKLSRSRVSPNGLIVGHYEREGEIKIGNSMLDSPSEREIARQERMKRESRR